MTRDVTAYITGGQMIKGPLNQAGGLNFSVQIRGI